MTDRPKTGKRYQIYIPADLIDQWESTPRYERSAAVAAGLRLLWGVDRETRNVATNGAEGETEPPATPS